MDRLYTTKNIEFLAALLVKTWGVQALDRARILAGSNFHRVWFLQEVYRIIGG